MVYMRNFNVMPFKLFYRVGLIYKAILKYIPTREMSLQRHTVASSLRQMYNPKLRKTPI